VIEDVNTPQLTLKLPTWRPGRYERQNYAQNIYKVTAKNTDNLVLESFKVDTNTWVVKTNESEKEVRVNYDYYATQMDAGGTWLNEEQLYVNWITCSFQVMEKAELPYEVNLNLPKGYKIGTSLKKEGNKLIASNFFELVDSPFIASNTLQLKTYEVEGSVFYLWFQTDIELPWERIVKDFIAFTKAQIELFGGFPSPEYHFLFELLPYQHYHGVEHRNSTVITIGPSEKFEEELYDEFLGISSHELFHVWNVARIQPVEFIPYRLHEDTYFDVGYVLEGFTTFYGDYMLYRAGVWDENKYIEELNILFKRHFLNGGRHQLSIAESSIDLWVDGYKKGIPNRKVSIYVKGAIIALILHLKIKHSTQNNHSLDTIMKKLWENFGKLEKGYLSQDVIEIINEVTNSELTGFINNLLNGIEPLENILGEQLATIGYDLKKKEAESLHERIWGFKLKSNVDTIIEEIAAGSPASQTLCIDDEIIAVNGKRLTQSNINLLFKNTDSVSLTIFRRNKLCHLQLKIVDNQTFYFTFEIIQKTEKHLFI